MNRDHATLFEPGTLGYILQAMVTRSLGGIVMLAPGIARRILDEANFPGQRPIKPHRVEENAILIGAKLWRGSFAITIARLPDGTLWLVDGQHRLTAISKHDAPVPVRLVFDDVRDAAEARVLYASFDKPVSVRTDAEVLHASGVNEQMGVPPYVTKAAFEALPIINNDMEPAPRVAYTEGAKLRRAQPRIDALPDWNGELTALYPMLLEAPANVRRRLMSASCMAVALYTLRHQPTLAADFWGGLARNDGLRRTDPRAALLRDFGTRKANTGSARQGIQAPAVAWNAFFEGRELSIIKCLPDAAMVIAGTPLGRQRKAAATAA